MRACREQQPRLSAVPQRRGRASPGNLQELDTTYWADKLIGYINTVAEAGLLPKAKHAPRRLEPDTSPPYRYADKEREPFAEADMAAAKAECNRYFDNEPRRDDD